jgi:alcohol dehydrogenase class IV
VNLEALRARAPDHFALPRFQELAVLLTGQPEARAEDALAWVRELVRSLRVPRLRALGLRDADVPGLVTKARAASSMKGNPLPLTDAELTALVQRSM